MSDKDKQIIMEFKKRLGADLLSHVRSILLFGSRARGDAAPDSDLDLAVLVDKKNPELEKSLDNCTVKEQLLQHPGTFCRREFQQGD